MEFAILILVQPFILFYAGAGIQNRWVNWLYIASGSVFALGLFLLILHWPYGQEMVSLSSSFCLLMFGYNFINSPVKQKQDYLLLAWLICFATHYIKPDIPDLYRYYIRNAASILMWINVVYAIYLHSQATEEE